MLFVAAIPLFVRAELLPIRSYTTADGLAADHVDCIFPDSRGFIWFCTPEGLTRFDGYRMMGFGPGQGLPHQVVQAILETRFGDYLVGTAGGLGRFHASGGGNTFSTYTPGADRFENNITVLRQTSSGTIWCGTAGGLFELAKDFRFRRQPLPGPFLGWQRNVVTDIVEDLAGNLWVATVAGVDVVGKDATVQHISTDDGLPHEFVNALLLDNSGRIWAGTRAGLALMRAGGAGGVQQVYREQDGLINPDIRALAQDAGGAIWIATSGGISRLLPGRAAGFQNFMRRHGLIDRNITALASDHAGNMWVGTEGAGVMRIESAGFTTFREADGLASDRVWSVLQDRHGTVLAVDDSQHQPRRSVNIFDGARFRAVAPKIFRDQPTWGWHQILLQGRSGEWWAATRVGLCRFRAMDAAGLSGRAPQACYARDMEVFRVFEDSQGGIWASAQSKQGDRLMRWDPAANALLQFDGGPRPAQLVSAFAEDHRGNIWMGIWGGGSLYRYDGRQFARYEPAVGLPAGTIFALMVDRAGRLWIASDNGLGLIENPGSPQPRVRFYDITKGLASNSIRCLTEDNTGRIYAGTAKGVDRLNPATGYVKHFSPSDGLARGEMMSALRDTTGSLWFATTQGLSRLRPIADRPPAIPSVRISDLRIPRAATAVSLVGESLLQLGKLQPWQNELEVGFVGFNDEPEENLSYEYKLEGAESDWTETRQHTVNYAALKPGRYRFLVKAVNSDGQTSPTPAQIDFVVLPTLLGRWWFRALLLMLAGALTYLFYRYRLRRLLEMERLRTRIATDLHDDIGSSLTQIAILSEVTSRRIAPEQQTDLADIASLSRELVDSMSEIVWAIDPAQDRMGDLVHRMRRFAGDLFTPAGVSVHFQAPAEEQQDPEMGPDIRRQIFLIFKEALHNMARHSGCTEVQIDFRLEMGWLSLTLRDDGKGFDPAQFRRGHGLASMERRAQQLGGCLSVDAAPGRGTAIRVKIPIGQPFLGRRKKSYTNG